MSGHHAEHRGCEAMASTSGSAGSGTPNQSTPKCIPVPESTAHVLSDTDSGVADTEERSCSRSSNRSSGQISLVSGITGIPGSRGAVPRSRTSTTSASTSSNVDLNTLRDPNAYETLNVIGNGKSTKISLFYVEF